MFVKLNFLLRDPPVPQSRSRFHNRHYLPMNTNLGEFVRLNVTFLLQNILQHISGFRHHYAHNIKPTQRKIQLNMARIPRDRENVTNDGRKLAIILNIFVTKIFTRIRIESVAELSQNVKTPDMKSKVIEFQFAFLNLKCVRQGPEKLQGSGF